MSTSRDSRTVPPTELVDLRRLHVGEALVEYHWSPIEGLTPEQQKIELKDLDNVAGVWRDVRAEMDPAALQEFVSRLNRHIAVETGILEGLYTVSHGLTQTLVEQGFTSDVIDRSSEPISAATIGLIRDQLEASDFVMDVVGGARPLSKSFIKEVQALLTRNQRTTPAIDSQGRLFDVELLHGEFKKLPNNPTTKSGSVHEYAPPEQVDSEMDVLVRRLGEYDTAHVHPVVLSAWLHHRFTQIHPFQDGNGRVARQLSSLVCIRGGLFPLRIVREEKDQYLGALAAADHRDLMPLVRFFADVEKSTMVQAMTPDVSFGVRMDRPATGLAEQVAARIAQRLGEKTSVDLGERRRVAETARTLRERIVVHLDRIRRTASEQFERRGVAFRSWVDMGGPENARDYWWRGQVTRAAKGKHFANLSEDHYWARLGVELVHTELTFVVSIHHVGRPITGVMAMVFFAELTPLAKPETAAAPETQFLELGVDPVSFTRDDALPQVLNRVMPLLDQAVALALRDLGNVVA